MNENDFKWALAGGLPIKYMNIEIIQPTIKHIDDIGIFNYFSFTYPYCIKKETLGLSEEFQNDLKDYSLFQTLFIYDDLLRKSSKWEEENSLIASIYKSLLFFLDIKDTNKLKIVDFCFVYFDDNSIPIWKLDNSNFEEFSELIRIITNSELFELQQEENKKQYEDKNMQDLYEELLNQSKKQEEEKKKENKVTLADIRSAICSNISTKYNFFTIKELTIWQMYYEFNNMLIFDGVNITKQQYTSGNFKFEKEPDINWFNKIKIKLPKQNIFIKEE